MGDGAGIGGSLKAAAAARLSPLRSSTQRNSSPAVVRAEVLAVEVGLDQVASNPPPTASSHPNPLESTVLGLSLTFHTYENT